MGKSTISMAIFNSYFDITRPGFCVFSGNQPTQWKNDTWATGVCANRKITTSKRETLYERPKRGSRWFKIWRKQTQGYNKWSWFLWNLPAYICFYQLSLIHADLVPSLPWRYSCDGLGIGPIMSILHARWVCPRFCWQNLSPHFPIGFLLLYVLYFLLVQALVVCQATLKLKVWEEGGHHGLWENARVGVLKKRLSTLPNKFANATSKSGWWFQTCFMFHFIYGMSSFPLTNSYFSRWLLQHHQPNIYIYIYIIIYIH